VLLVAAINIMYKTGWEILLKECALVFANGIMSMVITIGLLPFLESTFNVITPLRLLELANPNQPLLKRLLMEAPGTYHHSLMVGTLRRLLLKPLAEMLCLPGLELIFTISESLKGPISYGESNERQSP